MTQIFGCFMRLSPQTGGERSRVMFLGIRVSYPIDLNVTIQVN